MARYYLIKGKPGLPVTNPHDTRVFLGLAGGKRKGEPIEQLVEGHSHVADAIAKGNLELLGGPVIAANHDEARALLAQPPPKTLPRPSKAGGEK